MKEKVLAHGQSRSRSCRNERFMRREPMTSAASAISRTPSGWTRRRTLLVLSNSTHILLLLACSPPNYRHGSGRRAMVKKQAERFAFIDVEDPHWRSKARSHLTRNQRNTRRVREPTREVRNIEDGLRPRELASRDEVDCPDERDNASERLAIAKQVSPWTLLDPSRADSFSTLPIAGPGKFERIAMDHCKYIGIITDVTFLTLCRCWWFRLFKL